MQIPDMYYIYIYTYLFIAQIGFLSSRLQKYLYFLLPMKPFFHREQMTAFVNNVRRKFG